MTNRSSTLLTVVAALAAAPAFAADPVKLTKEETQQALAGKSISYGGRNENTVILFFAAGGNFSARTTKSSRSSSGEWTVDDDGRFCVKIRSGTAPDGCRHLYKTDGGFAMSNTRGTEMVAIDKLE